MKTPELICRGNSFDVGFKHGLLLKEAVQSNLANFWSASQALGLERFALVQKAKQLAQEYTDGLIEEIQSVARGASVDLGELLAFNLCHGEVFPDECSVLFAMGDVTASGNTLFSKNSDKIGGDSMEGPNFYKHKEINVVLVVRPEDGPGIVGISAAGSTGLKMGVSDLGIAVGTNIARTVELGKRKVDTTQMRALDRVQLAREGLQKETALEAANYVLARISENPTATPGNIEFVEATTGVIVEGSYDRVALQVVKSGIASRSNSFVVMKDLNDPSDVSSYCRYVRSQQLLKENAGRLTADLMKQFSQDHLNGPGPNSLCRHGEHYSEETSQSSMVVEIDPTNPKETRLWIALGKPCQAWNHPDGFIERTMNRWDDTPEGFSNGEVWKRFWTEEPRFEQEVLQA